MPTSAGFGSSVLILATLRRQDADDAVRELAGRVDGLAIMGQSIGDDVVEEIAATGLPLVLLARDPVPGVDTIRTRNEGTAASLTEHLLGHGYRSFAFLGDPEASPDVAGRYAGTGRSSARTLRP